MSMENYYIQIANEHKISVEKLEATMGQVIAYLYVHRHKTIGNRILWEIILSENPEVIREILEHVADICLLYTSPSAPLTWLRSAKPPSP